MSNDNSVKSQESGATKVSGSKSRSTAKKKVDLTQLIPVMNGFQGKLIYVSPRTGEKFEWDGFGDEQEIELRELKSAKSSSKSFFVNNWFMFDDEYQWVIEYLGLSQYYKNSIALDDFDSIFDMKPDEVISKISGMSAGQKNSLKYKAREKVRNDEVDSRGVIKALEKALGVNLEDE